MCVCVCVYLPACTCPIKSVLVLQGNNRMVYAWNNNRPTSVNDIMYHKTNRGSQGVTFFDDGRAKNETAHAKSLNLTVDGVSGLLYYLNNNYFGVW